MTRLRELGTDVFVGAYQAYFGKQFCAEITSEEITFFDCDYFADSSYRDTRWTVRTRISPSWKVEVAYNEHTLSTPEDIDHLRQYASWAQAFIENHLEKIRKQEKEEAKEQSESEETPSE